MEHEHFITKFITARHLSLSWSRSIQSMPLHPMSLRSTLILSSHLSPGLPSDVFPSGLTTKTQYEHLLSPILATCPAQLILLADQLSHPKIALVGCRCLSTRLNGITVQETEFLLPMRSYVLLTRNSYAQRKKENCRCAIYYKAYNICQCNGIRTYDERSECHAGIKIKCQWLRKGAQYGSNVSGRYIWFSPFCSLYSPSPGQVIWCE